MPHRDRTIIANAECLLLATLHRAAGVVVVIKSEMVRYSSRLFEPVRRVLEESCEVDGVVRYFESSELAGGRGSITVYALCEMCETPTAELVRAG